MKKLIGSQLVLLFALSLHAGGAISATVPFSDNFDAAAAGGTILNWTGSPSWEVTSGSVDLVKSGDYGISCIGASGGCVDLDGSTNHAGNFRTVASDSFTFQAGKTYELSAYISGNQRGGPVDDVEMGFRNTLGNTPASLMIENIASAAAFTLYSVIFKPTTDFVGQIFFHGGGGDNVGAILDNVSLQAVPIPAAGWLLISGLIGLVAVARRRTA